MRRKFCKRIRGSVGQALVTGGVLLGATGARAGYWEVLPNTNSYPNGPNPTIAMWPQLRQGTTKFEVTTGLSPSAQTITPRTSVPWENTSSPYGWGVGLGYTSHGSSSLGGLSYQNLDGTAKALFQWKRNTLPNSTTLDPNDNPPQYVSVFINARGSGNAWTKLPTKGTGATAASIHANATVSLAKGASDVMLWSEVKSEPEHKETIYESGTPKAKANASQSGQYFLLLKVSEDKAYVPAATLKSYAQADGGRGDFYTYYNYPRSDALDGFAEAAASYDPAKIDTTFSPSPDGLALMDCANPSKPLNQKVLNGRPCIISCSVSFSGLSPQTGLWFTLRNGFDWRLVNTPQNIIPLPYTNNVADQSNGSFTVKARAMDNQTNPISSVDGLAFDARLLPSSNADFGQHNVEHLFNGSVIATAPVALFYSVNGTNHPPGGPPGYTHNAGPDLPIDTPNWIYYYNQAWQAPCPIYYSPSPSDSGLYGYYTHTRYSGDSFVRLCAAHGEKWTLIFRKGSDGWLKIVGREKVKGIDTFARVATHENTHKRCWEAILNGWADLDGDEVPDAWEQAVGMKVAQGVDSAGFIAAWGGKYEPWEADRETFARLYEEGVFAPSGGDWADDGLNWGITAPNACPLTRTLKEDNQHQPVASFPGSPVSPRP